MEVSITVLMFIAIFFGAVFGFGLGFYCAIEVGEKWGYSRKEKEVLEEKLEKSQR